MKKFNCSQIQDFQDCGQYRWCIDLWPLRGKHLNVLRWTGPLHWCSLFICGEGHRWWWSNPKLLQIPILMHSWRKISWQPSKYLNSKQQTSSKDYWTKQEQAVSIGLYGHVNFCLTLSPLLISIHSRMGSQLPLTESSVTVIHYYTILFKSILESQWDSHWQLIARPADEYWLKTSCSLQRSRLAEPHLSTSNSTGGARRLSEARNKHMRTRLDGENCCIHRFHIYSSHACFSSRQTASLSVCREAGGFTSSTVCVHGFMHLSRLMWVFAYSLFICPPERGVFSYLWPLKVQGWHAITKTALSITLTDRLKRGFNSYSSPWALHHWGRYPSMSLLSRFIVSSCQSFGGLAKWPLFLPRSFHCVPSYPLDAG